MPGQKRPEKGKSRVDRQREILEGKGFGLSPHGEHFKLNGGGREHWDGKMAWDKTKHQEGWDSSKKTDAERQKPWGKSLGVGKTSVVKTHMITQPMRFDVLMADPASTKWRNGLLDRMGLITMEVMSGSKLARDERELKARRDQLEEELGLSKERLTEIPAGADKRKAYEYAGTLKALEHIGRMLRKS
jgi:hypothetical protein